MCCKMQHLHLQRGVWFCTDLDVFKAVPYVGDGFPVEGFAIAPFRLRTVGQILIHYIFFLFIFFWPLSASLMQVYFHCFFVSEAGEKTCHFLPHIVVGAMLQSLPLGNSMHAVSLNLDQFILCSTFYQDNFHCCKDNCCGEATKPLFRYIDLPATQCLKV